MIKRILAGASALALSGCMVGPDYVSPAGKQPAPAKGAFVSADGTAFTPAEPPREWWHLYRDPLVDRLVGEALAANTDLRVAAANLRQAQAVLRESRAGRLPTTDLSASGQYTRQAGATFGQAGGGFESEVYSLGLESSYQVDLFGRIARTIEASRADLQAVQATYDQTRITVVAETIRAYADSCSAAQQLAVARETLRLQEETFDLTRRRVEAGRGTALDTSQASALLEQTRAQVPTLEATQRAALFRLATLTGRPPAEAPAEVLQCTAPPRVETAIPVGDGTALLARRPDVRAAERRLAAASARIGVATAALYPDISIGGSIGTTALEPDQLFTDSGFRFGIGPLISWSFPNIAVARARIRQAEATADAALATFDGAWLTALQETETALTRYVTEGRRVATLRRAREQSAEAARIARLRYEAGAEDFQTALDAERTLANAEAQLAQAQASFSDNTISLFLALGGGWEAPAAQ